MNFNETNISVNLTFSVTIGTAILFRSNNNDQNLQQFISYVDMVFVNIKQMTEIVDEIFQM